MREEGEMRLNLQIGSEKLRIPSDGSKTIGWLQSEVIRRWEKRHKGEFLAVKEIRTQDNVRLDENDQIIEVCKEDETLICLLSRGTEDVQPGDMVNQYYLTNLIGEGTYGRVFRAHDLNLNRFVAVKVLRKEKANEVNTRRFLREAELNGLLSNNPYVVTVHDFGRTRSGVLYIVMELLKGRPMNELLDERIMDHQPFTVFECIHIMSPVLKGLHVAHTHDPSIVHRDLKPDNIWLNESKVSGSKDPLDYAAKIMDFGIAVHDELTHQTLACGTRMYSSPEQTRKNVKLDGRSDIWSVGVILYQMLCLLVDVPFDPVEINLGQEVPDIRKYLVTPASENMCNIVMKALSKNRDERFPSAESMSDVLHAEESALLASAGAFAPPSRVRRMIDEKTLKAEKLKEKQERMARQEVVRKEQAIANQGKDKMNDESGGGRESRHFLVNREDEIERSRLRAERKLKDKQHRMEEHKLQQQQQQQQSQQTHIHSVDKSTEETESMTETERRQEQRQQEMRNISSSNQPPSQSQSQSQSQPMLDGNIRTKKRTTSDIHEDPVLIPAPPPPPLPCPPLVSKL